MTEAEAKTKWCPFVRGINATDEHCRISPTNQSPFNVIFGPKGNESRVPCIGSACMAWRWRDDAVEVDFTDAEPPTGEGWAEVADYTASRDARFSKKWSRPRPNRHGFCGLAGAPQ